MPIRYLLELVLLAALWGASFLFMRVATPEFGAVALIEIRVLIASLFLLPLWLIREPRGTRRRQLRKWRELMLLGTLNSAIPFVLFAFSTLHITGGFSSILNSTASIWAALVAWVWLGVKPTRSVAVGLLLGMIGVITLVSGSVSMALGGATLGIAAATFAAFLYGVAANYTTVKLNDVSALTIATFSLLAAALILLPVSLAFIPEQTISTRAWLAVLAMGIFSTAFANILYFHLLGAVGSTQAITVTFLIPIFGTLWGVLFINETVSSEMLVGAVIILLGTSLVTRVVSLSGR